MVKMTVHDALKELGMKQGCKMKDVQASFRKLALKYHPDKNKNSLKSLEKMQKINEAYSICKEYYINKQKIPNFTNIPVGKNGWAGSTDFRIYVNFSGGGFGIKIDDVEMNWDNFDE